jgi:hypothetical protein
VNYSYTYIKFSKKFKYPPENKNSMNKKVVIGVIIILFLVIVAYCMLRPTEVVYSDNPEDWIDETPNETLEVNFEQVTKGAGEFNDINEEYKDALIDTVFGYDGIYEGEFFKNEYYDLQTEKVIMEITNDMNPNDGVLQGVIAERVDNDQPVAFIFLDEDWRNKLGNNVNIVWGADYQNTKQFEYISIKEGVYMNQIADDRSRFGEFYDDIHQGGIVVGDVSITDVKEGNTDGKTIMMLS